MKSATGIVSTLIMAIALTVAAGCQSTSPDEGTEATRDVVDTANADAISSDAMDTGMTAEPVDSSDQDDIATTDDTGDDTPTSATRGDQRSGNSGTSTDSTSRDDLVDGRRGTRSDVADDDSQSDDDTDGRSSDDQTTRPPRSRR
ncbi:MAG: hypothetical protein H6817_03980 [Phycisphaerales bacterium]|nr:hypothetical protein [Phycisphaerales bacterium]